MTEIKICGITNRDDALFAASCGAHALGFIFYAKSPRSIAPEKAKEIIEALPANVARIGVFVNQGYDEIERIRALCSLDMVQLHGDESPEFCGGFPQSIVIKAFAPRTMDDLRIIERYPEAAVLIDARAPGLYGGTGTTPDWNLARQAATLRPLILAGGLNPGNIEAALASVSPAAVDLNSGVETAPGKKNHQKIRAAIDLIRAGKREQRDLKKTIFRLSAQR